MKCLACGVEKDPTVKELYPWPDEDHITDRPIQPFFSLDCEPNDDTAAWKRVTVCHGCFHRLQPDMWISQQCWEALVPPPVVPFADLPNLK